MKITHLKLKDFGPHEHLDIDLSANIVGIIGSNGSGKSNLLQAINYALTGDLNKTNQQKYIRNFGTENGPKKAVVELTFEKEGKVGKITREITGTASKRLLTWEGSEYRKQEDVERVLSEVLSADKAVLTNAVFIKQGSISNLVQGTPSERQEIFQKLFHLSFVSKLDQDLLSKISALQAGVVDYRPQIDLVCDDLTVMNSNLEDEKKQAEKLDKVIKGAEDVKKLLSIGDDSSRVLVELRESVKEKTEAEEALSAFISNAGFSYNGGSTDTEAVISQLKKEIEKATEEDNRSRMAISMQEALEAANNSYEAAAAKAQAIADALTECREASTISSEQAETMEQWLAKEPEVVAHVLKAAELKNDLVGATDELKEAESTVESINTRLMTLQLKKDSFVPEWEKELEAQSDKARHLKLKVNAYGMGDGAVCPLCGAPMATHSNETLEDLNVALHEAESQVQQHRAWIEEIDAALSSTESDLQVAKVVLKSSRDAYDRICTKLEAFSQWPYPEFKDTVHEIARQKDAKMRALSEYKTQLQKLQVLEAKDEAAKLQVEAAEDSVRKATVKYLQEGFEDELSLSVCASNAFNTASKLHKLNSMLADITMLVVNLQKAVDKHYKAGVRVDELSQQADAIMELPDVQSYIKRFEMLQEQTFALSFEDCRRKLRADLELDISSREVSRRRIGELMSDIARKEAQLADLYEKRNANNRRVELINMLQMARNVVGKNGAPRDYCNHVFAQITDVVHELLVNMGANFVVEPDPERPLTYNFIRTDNDDGYVMGQERLSGGQAIRLAMALLIACQRMVLPDVGLLVLDEPSSHIDAEGVANMRDMMLQLGQLLESADMQLIVVDHNDTLSAAFGKTIRLTKAAES